MARETISAQPPLHPIRTASATRSDIRYGSQLRYLVGGRNYQLEGGTTACRPTGEVAGFVETAFRFR
jgi:tetrahydromethanopterin S-methyltransferase subunit F